MRPAARQRRLDAGLLLAPLTLFLLALLAFPLAADLLYSLSTVRFATLREPAWAGLANYAAALGDPAFGRALLFSAGFAAVTTLAEVVLGLFLALALAPLLARRGWLTAVLLAPMMLSPALVGTMWRLILNEFVGVVPQYLLRFGIEVDLLGPDWVWFTLALIEVGQWTPFAFLILLTARQAVAPELLEAATVDGASAWARTRAIVLPLLAPALGVTAIIRLIDGFRVFDHIWVLTGGGPGDLTTSASIYIYKGFFQNDRLGPAVAAALILFAATLVIAFLLTRRRARGALA